MSAQEYYEALPRDDDSIEELQADTQEDQPQEGEQA